MSSFYDYSVPTPNGEQVSMKDFEGKVVLVVNTATGCGFTPQYKELQEIYNEFHDKGLEILDFPCNQFGDQAPGTNEEIHTFCTGRFGITFPQFSKLDVLGENADPLFVWLSENTKFEGFGKGAKAMLMNAMLHGIPKENPDIRWNFTKFIVDRQGHVVARFEPTADMADVDKCVATLL